MAQQTENSTVANSSPSGAYLTSNLVTFSGEIDVSQLLFDQAGPVGIDKIVYQQLNEALQTQLDSYTITQALSSAGSVSGASVWSNANAWGDLAKASANMRTVAGAVLAPTHLFASPTFFSWMLAQVDDQHRPLLTPQPAGTYLPVSSGPDGDVPAGWTGQRLLSSNVLTDGNIPNVGSNCQLLVANPANIFTLCSEPVTRAIPETLANDMSVAIQLYCVFGVIVRHTAVVQTITGNAYPASPSFA